MQLITTILAFLIALAVLIVVHELGHFAVARWCGVRVLRFSVGFGKPLWRWQRDPRHTEWVISAVPFGGYVRMLDETDPECTGFAPEELTAAFNRQRLGARAAIVLAGPLANFLLAIVVYTGINMLGTLEPAPYLAEAKAGSPAARSSLREGDLIVAVDRRGVASWGDVQMELVKAGLNARPTVLTVQHLDGSQQDCQLDLTELGRSEIDDAWLGRIGLTHGAGAAVVQALDPKGVAAAAGIQPGDRVEAIDDLAVEGAGDLTRRVRSNSGDPQRWTLLRSSVTPAQHLVVTLTPALAPLPDGTSVRRVGIDLQVRNWVSYPPGTAMHRALRSTWDTSVMSVRMVGRMITGESSWRNVSGALTVADFAGQAARVGVVAYAAFIAFVSISLGVLNLLPIPVLDGGHLLYYAVELAKGSPVSGRTMAVAQRLGIGLLVLLTGLALFNDLTRLLSLQG